MVRPFSHPRLLLLAMTLLAMPRNVELCFWMFDSARSTSLAGSLSTPPPPPAVISDCGHNKYYYSANQPGVGIVGGQNIEHNQYPWIARLRIEKAGSGASLCGATIINNMWLLTAAHCVDDKLSPSDITATFADYHRSSMDSSEYSQKITSVVIHVNYNAENQDYDFALLKLSNPLSFQDWNTQKICLPKSCSDGCGAGTYAYIAGWGTTSEYISNAAKIMQTGLVKIVDSSSCGPVYSRAGKQITDRMICASLSGVDTCSGDSGGPLMVVEDGFYKLCGVTSFGIGCARAAYPGIYGRVCSVIDWIHEKANM